MWFTSYSVEVQNETGSRVHSLEFMKDRKQGIHYGVPGRRQQSIAMAEVQSH